MTARLFRPGVVLLAVASTLHLEPCTLNAAVQDPSRYLDVVRGYADALLEHGLDVYGPRRTGAILSVLDRRSLGPPEELPPPPAGVRSTDRAGAYGSNANLQLNLYRTLFLLSEITGEERYAEAAEAALVDLMRYAQSPETGLLGWGEHLYYDTRTDEVAGGTRGDGSPYPLYHEMKREFLHSELLWELEPDRMERFARGLWDHQIQDKRTGNFSRHARWDVHGPETDYDFPKEAGYMLEVWARAYRETGDPVFLRAIDVLVSRYERKINDRDLIDFDSARPNETWPSHTLSLATDLHLAAELLPPGPLPERMRSLARRFDRGFLRLLHWPADPEKGFVIFAYTDLGLPRPHPGGRGGGRGYSPPWGMVYGSRISANVALQIYGRMLQIPGTAAAKDYERLVLQAADLYHSSPAPAETHDLWAQEYGMAIFLQLAVHRITGDSRYLHYADELGREAVERFWGDSPLPRASTRTDHYEAITGTDTLALALLALHHDLEGGKPQISISNLDR